MFNFFGLGNNKIREALRDEATIVDVRTVHEYDQGRIRGSVNIPLDRIPSSIPRIRQMKKPIIFCANGDGRSGSATRFIKSNGIKEVVNGGSWEKLALIIKDL
jgi:rhodanese-related sulfurtransferase